MSILVAIPKYILWNYIMVEMLSVHDLAILEVACANNKLKAQLEIFQSIEWTGVRTIHLTDPAVEWLCNHHIGITSLTFTSNFTKGFVNDKGPLTSVRLALRKGIEDLEASTFRRSFIFLRVLELSPNLKSVHIANCSTLHSNSNEGKAKLLKHISKMCPSVMNFTLSFCDENVIPYVFDLFPQLHSIQFSELFVAAHSSQNSTTNNTTSNNGSSSSSSSNSIISPNSLRQNSLSALNNNNNNNTSPILSYPNIHTIKCDYLSYTLAQRIGHCPNLSRLELIANDDDELSDDIMSHILQNCPNISYLSISFPSSQGISDRICQSIASNCYHNLKQLQLLNCMLFTLSMARILSPIIPNLTYFCWDSVTIESNAIYTLLRPVCKAMEYFQIGDAREDEYDQSNDNDNEEDEENEDEDDEGFFDEQTDDDESQNNNHISHVITHSPLQNTFNNSTISTENSVISSITGINNNTGNITISGMNNNENIVLPDRYLSSDDIKGIMKSCSNLRALTLKYPTPANDTLLYLSFYCQSIESIQLHIYQNISGESMNNLFKNCLSLHSFSLMGSHISSEAIVSIATYGTQLKTLKLNFSEGYPHIYSNDVNVLLDSISLNSQNYDNNISNSNTSNHTKSNQMNQRKEIMLLSIQSKKYINMQTLSYIAASFKRVRYLDIKCRSFTHVSSNHLPYGNLSYANHNVISHSTGQLIPFVVSYLRLREMDRLLDYKLIRFAKCIRRLQRLSISSCSHLTAISVSAIASTMEGTLRSISIDDCDSISEEPIEQLSKAFPTMKISMDDGDDDM